MFVLIFEYYTFENENTCKPCNQNYDEKKKQYKTPKKLEIMTESQKFIQKSTNQKIHDFQYRFPFKHIL